MQIPPAREQDVGETLYQRFGDEPDTLVIGVVDEESRPVGLIERNSFFLKMAAAYGRAVWAQRSIAKLMDTHPLVVEGKTLLRDFTATALLDRPSDLLRGFIVAEEGRYLGVGSPLALLQALNNENARSAESQAKLVQELEEARAGAERARLFMETVIERMPVMIAVRRAEDGSYVLLNGAGEKMLGRARHELVGRTPALVFPPEDALKIISGDEAVIRAPDTVRTGADEISRADGRPVVLRTHKTAFLNDATTPRFILSISEDITEQVAAEAHIAHMAHHDPLTDLANRVLFHQTLTAAVNRAGEAKEMVALLCLDLDRFKFVNDTFGHPAGDNLLKQVAGRLKGCTRTGDLVARLGGDEFAVVQTGVRSPSDARLLAERIVAALSAPFSIHGQDIIVGTSIGIALAPSDGDSPDQLLKLADLALYRAKAEGRGSFQFYEKGMDEAQRARRLLDIDLRRALADQEFELHYQPVLDLCQNGISGFEALLRWNHPTRGLLLPADFISLAEEIGLIVRLGPWLIRRACQEAASWPQPLRVAVNISAVQLRDPEFALKLVQILDETGLPPDRLELEITESVLMQSDAATERMLHQLRDLGVRFALDDFGTGYSSLSYLRSFPFDKIKIDQSFIHDLPDGANARAIVRAVVSLAGSLGIVPTAEGVETAEQLTLLKMEGCREVQGYFVGPPCPADALGPFMTGGPWSRRRRLAMACAPSQRHRLPEDRPRLRLREA